MNFRGRGRRGYYRRRGGVVQQNFSSVIRHERIIERGLVIRSMPSDPPKVVIAPWNSITIVKDFTVGINETVQIRKSAVIDYLRVQLGLPATVPNTFVRLRFLKVRAWLDAAGTNVPIALLMRPFSLIGEGDNTKVEDWTGEVQYAKCGYVWPRSQQVVAFESFAAADDIIVSLAHSGPASKHILLYLDILWASQVDVVSLFRSFRLSDDDDSIDDFSI